MSLPTTHCIKMAAVVGRRYRLRCNFVLFILAVGHHQVTVLHVDQDVAAVGDLSRKEGSADARFELVLEVAFERPRAVDGIVGDFGDVVPGRIGNVAAGYADPSGALHRSLVSKLDDRLDFLESERLEEDDIVHPIQEFRSEMAAQLAP